MNFLLSSTAPMRALSDTLQLGSGQAERCTKVRPRFNMFLKMFLRLFNFLGLLWCPCVPRR